jgi:hypothetical protein
LTPFAAADGVFGDAVGTRLAVLATLDASGVVARLVLHGAVLRFRVHRDRLATSYRLVLDFRPLCDNLLAALDAARSAQYVILSRKIIHETGGFRVRRGESQCPHLGWSIAPVLRATFVIAQHIPMPSF